MSQRFRRHSWKKRLARGLLLYAFIPYLVVAAGLAVFQRRLLYPGSSGPSDKVTAETLDGRRHDLQLTTYDGLNLAGVLHAAQDRPVESIAAFAQQEKPRRLVIYFPGNAGRRSDRTSECLLFTQLDCDVVLFDYRGYAENPGAPTESDLAADARSLWTFVKQELNVPADKIYLFGESLGGGIATRLASEQSQLGEAPAALILSATFSSMTDAAASHYPFVPVRWLLLDRYPSVERIPSVTCPIVMLHGTDDEIVPFHLAEKLFAAAPSASREGIEKSLVTVEGAGHDTIPFDVTSEAVSTLGRTIAAAHQNLDR